LRAARGGRGREATSSSTAISLKRLSATGRRDGSAASRPRPRRSRSRAGSSGGGTRKRRPRPAACPDGRLAPAPGRRHRACGTATGRRGLYLKVGSPDLPGQPLAARAADVQNQSIDHLVGQVEAHLEANPDDVRGWEVIAPVYLRLGRFDDAVKARRKPASLGRETAERQSDLGEALVGTATASSRPRRRGRSIGRSRSIRRTSRRDTSSGSPPSRMVAKPTRYRCGARCWPAPRKMRLGGFVRGELARLRAARARADDLAAAADMGPSSEWR